MGRSQTSLKVLYEDNHLLVIDKPAEVATMGAAPGATSLYDLAKQYLKTKYDKPGNVYLGIVSRLDAVVTGVVVLARTSKAASRLSKAFSDGSVDKGYWALISDHPEPDRAHCRDWLRKDERQRRVVVCPANHPEAKPAALSYEMIRRCRGRRALLQIKLETGRKHQIRVQLAHRGWPILGDRKYGSELRFPSGIALHARTLRFTHPVQKIPLEFSATLPPAWDRFVAE